MRITLLHKLGRYDQNETIELLDSVAKRLIARGVATSAAEPKRAKPRRPAAPAEGGGGPQDAEASTDG